jgi:hypothetical protein
VVGTGLALFLLLMSLSPLDGLGMCCNDRLNRQPVPDIRPDAELRSRAIYAGCGKPGAALSNLTVATIQRNAAVSSEEADYFERRAEQDLEFAESEGSESCQSALFDRERLSRSSPRAENHGAIGQIGTAALRGVHRG